jgi:glycosyltransferase involved in cell wall biosynthesis
VRIALACDWFLKYAAAQAAALAATGTEVVLVCREHPFEFGDDQRERIAAIDSARAAGARVLELPGRLGDPAALPELIRIRRRLARFAPDIVHVHDRVDPRAWALLPLRAPTVLTIHDPAPHPGQPVARLAPKRWLLDGSRRAWRARARVVIVHSERLRNELRLRRDQRSAVVPHGTYVRSEPLAPPPVATVGFFGRLEPYKGLDVLASAMPRVWEVRPDVHLRVAGSGPTRLPLSDPRVRVDHGYLPEAEVEAFFRGTSLAVLPYTAASQTGAGSVAVGYGIPIVASRLGGLSDLVLDESYLVRAGDHTGLAAAIVAHVDDGREVRTRVLADVANRSSWATAAAISVRLYERVLAGR